MLLVSDFKNYLLKQLPPGGGQKSARPLKAEKETLFLYHYLHHFCPPAQIINFDLLQKFYRTALLFPYWQTRLSFLQQVVQEELAGAREYTGAANLEPEEWGQAPCLQLIKIQQPSSLKSMIQNYLQSRVSTGDKLTVLSLNKDRAAGVILKFDGRVRVESFGPMAAVHKGRLEPLAPLSQLSYQSSLQLNESELQVLEAQSEVFISFRLKNKKFSGQTVQGFTLQPLDHFTSIPLEQHDTLLTHLKQIESLYVQPETDPDYKQLVKRLHESYRQILVQKDTPLLYAEQTLSQARKAIKNLYPNNRLLLLLTANIDFHIQKQKASTRRPVLKTL